MEFKNTGFFQKIKYELAIFILLIIRALINIDFQLGMDKRFLVYYLADFSMGKTSRLIIGSLVNLLTDHPTTLWINCFAGVVLVITLLITAILVGRIIRACDDDTRNFVVVYSLFFISGSFTLYGYSKFFGMLDIYMYLFTLAAVLLVRKKIFKWLVPLFCLGGVAVNFAYAITYFPLVALVLLYLVFTEKKKAENILLLSVTVIICFIATVYCISVGNSTSTMTFEEVWAIFEQKIGMELDYSQVKYYDYYLFGNESWAEGIGLDVNNGSIIGVAKNYLNYMIKFGFNIQKILTVMLGLVPILVVFAVIWCGCIKEAETKPRKFVYLCFILSNLVMLISFATSTDTTRWACVGVMLQFALGYFMICSKDKPFEITVQKLRKKLQGKGVLIAVVYIIYAFGFELSMTG